MPPSMMFQMKKITKPMTGLQAFHSAKATLAGNELHHMLRKGQHTLSDDLTILTSSTDSLHGCAQYKSVL